MSASSPVDEFERSEAFFSRELSWLAFARRVQSLVARDDLPLLERVKFAGIIGMLHDEFFMKRMSGLKREVAKGVDKLSIDGRTPEEEFAACRAEITSQVEELGRLIGKGLLPGLDRAGLPIVPYRKLRKKERKALREYFKRNVQPILTPLAVDSEHPFPFISNLGLNLAVMIPDGKGERFVRIKVPGNRPRWVPVPGRTAVVPMEEVIAANLDLLNPTSPPGVVHLFRVTRGAEGELDEAAELTVDQGLIEPGSVIRQVSRELKARRFAGAVRLQVDSGMPKKLVKWLAKQIKVHPDDVYPTNTFLGLSDFQTFDPQGRDDLRLAPHVPVPPCRLLRLPADDSGAIFEEIARGDILLHHPYHSFESSVLRFLQAAAADPAALAIKLTIYRTSKQSPIISALVDAARRGKQVAVLVEITARFDEAPNIAWGSYLEQEGVHVAYGVERLKTHVKLALVVRDEADGIRNYAHVGTGNYHAGTAKVYEDVGVLTCSREVTDDVATVFNALTGAIPYPERGKLIVAPVSMRRRFVELIRREAEHARSGRPSGISAKMNQLQDAGVIRELYAANQSGVPIDLNVRGLCCLRPGVPGLSENIRVFGVVDRFLEHSRIFRFANGGEAEHYIGSADWMKRNLNSRVETVMPVEDPELKSRIDDILSVYDDDNCSAWDCKSDGTYVLRTPGPGEKRLAAQAEFIRRARIEAGLAPEPIEPPREKSVRAPRRVEPKSRVTAS